MTITAESLSRSRQNFHRDGIGLSQRLENMCGMFIVSVTSRLGCLSVPGEAHSPLKRMGHRLRLIAGRFRLLGNSLSFYLPVERSRIRLHFELCPSRSRRSVAELQRGISTLLGAQRKYYRVHPRRQRYVLPSLPTKANIFSYALSR